MSNELVAACRTGNTFEVIKLLQNPDIDINAPHTQTDTSPLFEALSNGHLEVVKALLASSKSLDTDNALLFASFCRDAEKKKNCLAFISKNFAKFKFKDGTTHAHIDAAAGDITFFRKVKREELNRTTQYHLTPMYFAAINCQGKITDWLATWLTPRDWNIVIDGEKIVSYNAKVASYVIDGFISSDLFSPASLFCAFILSKVEHSSVNHLQLLLKKITALYLQTEKYFLKHEKKDDAIPNLIEDLNQTLSFTDRSYLREISSEMVIELQLMLVRLHIEIEAFLSAELILNNAMQFAIAHNLQTKRIEEQSQILRAASILKWSSITPSLKKEMAEPLRLLTEATIIGDLERFSVLLPALTQDEWEAITGDILAKAVACGRVRMANLMIEESLKPNRSRIKSKYLLLHACLCANPKARETCLKTLFNNYDAIDFSDGTTRSHIAAALGDTKYLRKLKEPKELEASTAYGLKPMFFAMVNEQDTYRWYLDNVSKGKEFLVLDHHNCTVELSLLIGKALSKSQAKSKAMVHYTQLLPHLSDGSRYEQLQGIKGLVTLSGLIEKDLLGRVDLGFTVDHFIKWLKSIIVLGSRLETYAEISELNLMLLRAYGSTFKFEEAEELAKTTLRYALTHKLEITEIKTVIERIKRIRNVMNCGHSAPPEPIAQQTSLPPPVDPIAKPAPATIEAPKSTLESIDVDELKNKVHDLLYHLELKNKLYELFNGTGFLYRLNYEENTSIIEFTSFVGSSSHLYELAQIFKNVTSVGIEYDKQTGSLRVMRTNARGMIDLLQLVTPEVIEMKKHHARSTEQLILTEDEIKKWQAQLHELFCKAAEVKIKWDEKQQCFIAIYDSLTWNLTVGKKASIATVTDEFVENMIVSYVRRHCSAEANIVMEQNSREIKIYPLSKSMCDAKLLQSFIYSRMNLNPVNSPQTISEIKETVANKDNDPKIITRTVTLDEIRSLFSTTFGDFDQRFLFLKEKSHCRVYTLYYPFAQIQHSPTVGSINVLINIIRAINEVVGDTAISLYAFNHNIEIVINKMNLLADLSLKQIEKLNVKFKEFNAAKSEMNIQCPSVMDPTVSFDLIQLFYEADAQAPVNHAMTTSNVNPSLRDLNLLILAIRKLNEIERQSFDEILEVLSTCPPPETFDGTPQKDAYYFSYLYYAMHFFMIISYSIFSHTQFGDNNIFRLIRNLIRHDEHDSDNWQSYYQWLNPLIQQLKLIAPSIQTAPTITLFLNSKTLVKPEILNALHAALEPFVVQLGNRSLNRKKSQGEKDELLGRYQEYLLKVKFCKVERNAKVTSELMLRALSGKITKLGTDAEINRKVGHPVGTQLFSLFTKKLSDEYCSSPSVQRLGPQS